MNERQIRGRIRRLMNLNREIRSDVRTMEIIRLMNLLDNA